MIRPDRPLFGKRLYQGSHALKGFRQFADVVAAPGEYQMVVVKVTADHFPASAVRRQQDAFPVPDAELFPILRCDEPDFPWAVRFCDCQNAVLILNLVIHCPLFPTEKAG